MPEKTANRYWYLVGTDSNRTLYSGTDVADAMAAFTSGILDKDEYVILEALLEHVSS